MNNLQKLEIMKELEGTRYYTNIQTLYSICKSILSEIPSVFPNYTLHDINHSIRVIGYMNELIKHNIKDFSKLHLAIIVYVGLLHDIGMFATETEVKSIFEDLSRRRPDFLLLSKSDQKEAIKDVIRQNHAKRVKKMLKNEINDSTKINSLLFVGESYSIDLSDMVALICQSHCEDVDWIVNHLKDERVIEDCVINPQHIAFLLRIGDALDIDDRRAPFALYKLLNPKGKSDKEWRKHIPVNNYNKIRMNNDEFEIQFSGTCDSPNIYREILKHIDWLSNDIIQIEKNCARFLAPFNLKINAIIKNDIITIGF